MRREHTTAQVKSAPERKPATPRRSPSPPSPAIALQQRLGNQSLQSLLAHNARTAQGAVKPATSAPHAAAAPASAILLTPGIATDAARVPDAAGTTTVGESPAIAGDSRPSNSPDVSARAEVSHSTVSMAPRLTSDDSKAVARGAEAIRAEAPAALAPTIAAVHLRAVAARKHGPPNVAVASAQAAARTPRVEHGRAAAIATVGALDAAKSEPLERNAFKARLVLAIEAATPRPKTEAEAQRVLTSGGNRASETLRDQFSTVRHAVGRPLKAAAGDRTAAAESAGTGAELATELVGVPPLPVAARVAPTSLPAEQLDYSADRAATEGLMTENRFTDQSLRAANDPAFAPAIVARSVAVQHEATATDRYRQGEHAIQVDVNALAKAEVAQSLAGMHGARQQQIGQVVGQQRSTQGKDAAERQRITQQVNRIKESTQTDVELILQSMDNEAGMLFEVGLKRAEDAYETAFAEAKGGPITWLAMWGDAWKEHIEQALVKGRESYLREVDRAIDEAAVVVDDRLRAAKRRIALGRQEVERFVTGLDARVRQFGEEALQSVTEDFAALGRQVDSHRDVLVHRLTHQYKASYERMTALEAQLREGNQALWRRAFSAVFGLFQPVVAFKNMLLSILAQAADVVADIVAHPVRFLGNLVTGVLLGLRGFLSKVNTYLLKGLMEWLFGVLEGAGLQLPDKFDLEGIMSIVLQVLGISYANVRARAVKKVGEPTVTAIEKTAEIFRVLLTEGAIGLWRFIKEQVAQLKALVVDAIFAFIKERVIVAGISWIVGLLNPASAFFKACKAIYDIVMFFVHRGSQLVELASAVVTSLAAIARGAVGAIATAIENALARSIPVAIGFLASLTGVGDPSKPVRALIEKAQAPVNRAIDWAINLAVKGAKKIGRAVDGLVGKRRSESDAERDGDAERGGQSVYEAVYEALIARLGQEATIADAERVVQQLAEEFKPLGVKRILIGREEQDESQPILVEASPIKVAALLAKKEVQVAAHATITVREGAVLDELPAMEFRERHVREAERKAHNLPDPMMIALLPVVDQPPRAGSRMGVQKESGMIRRPQHGSNKLEIYSWNTGNPLGRKIRGNRYESIVSHAEYQFTQWFESQPDDWLKRVKSVELIVEGKEGKDVVDICDGCKEAIKGIETRHKHIKVKWKFVQGDKTLSESVRVDPTPPKTILRRQSRSRRDSD